MSDKVLKMLRGPDRVRKRPAVLFGSDDLEGAKAVVRSLLEIYVMESQQGYCTELTVTQHGKSLVIQGDDPGLYLGQYNRDDQVWKELFTEMYAGPAYAPSEDDPLWWKQDTHYCLYHDKRDNEYVFYPEDVDMLCMYAVQCVCKYLDVIVKKDNIKTTLRFCKGYEVAEAIHEPTEEANGTSFRLELDDEIFSETEIPTSYFLELLERFAFLCPALRCTYSNADGIHESFYYTNGVQEYVAKSAALAPFRHRGVAKGRDRYNRPEYEAAVEVVLGYAPDAGSLKCYHNFRELTYGGTHCDALKERVCRAFNDCFEDAELTFEELEKHLVIVLSTGCSRCRSSWENGTRLAIRNRMITDLTQDVAGHELYVYVRQHRALIQPLVDRLLKECSEN